MAQNDSSAALMLGLAPYLTIKGAAAAIDFYKKAFGAEEIARMPTPDGKLMHAHIRINGGHVLMSDDFGDQDSGEPKGVAIHLQVDDADFWWRRARDAGAAVKMELADQFWGDRYGQLRDPFGHSWSIGATIEK